MFLRFKWLELAYCLSAHTVILMWLVILAVHLAAIDREQSVVVQDMMGPMLLPAVASVILLFAVFAYAVLCSVPVALMYLKKYGGAERFYKLTFLIRRSIPLVGSSARSACWEISLANCYREQKRYEAAEALYRGVIDGSSERRGNLARMTHVGLREVAMENYAEQLRRTGRSAEAERLMAEIGPGLYIMRVKYAAVSALVLAGGIWFAVWENGQLAAMVSSPMR